MSDIPKAVREAVHARSGGRCERCGAVANNIHHRAPRGRGGASGPGVHDLANLLDVCGWGNASGCHGWIETHRTLAYEQGWLVRSGSNPTDVLVLRDGMWFQVTADALMFVKHQDREPPPETVLDFLENHSPQQRVTQERVGTKPRGVQCSCGKFASWLGETRWFDGNYSRHSMAVRCSGCGIVKVELV